MRTSILRAGAAGAVLVAGQGWAQAERRLVGFSSDGAAAERALEARFDSNPSASDIRQRLELMSSEPNQVGSPHDKANAEYTRQKFKEWGWDAHVDLDRATRLLAQ